MKVEGGHIDPPRINYFQKAQPWSHKVGKIIKTQSLTEEPIIVHMYDKIMKIMYIHITILDTDTLNLQVL